MPTYIESESEIMMTDSADAADDFADVMGWDGSLGRVRSNTILVDFKLSAFVTRTL